MPIRAILAFVVILGVGGEALAGDEALLRAAQRGDLATVRARLKAGIDVNDYEGEYSPLMHAASNGHTKIVHLLLENGANVEHRDHNKDTALLWSAEGAPLEIVRILIDAGAKVDHATGLRETPLMRAAREGRAEVVKLLLARGAAIDFLDDSGCTALHDAVLSRKVGVVKALLDAGAEVNVQGRILKETPLISIASYGEGAIVRVLVAAKAKLDLRDHEGCTALWRAAAQGHANVVNHLLEHDADAKQKSNEGVSPFAAALAGGHVPVGRLLLSRIGDLGQALLACCRAGSLELARPLLERGATADVRGLHAVSEGGHVHLLTALLESGIKATATNEAGVTALMQAAAKGHVLTVQVLLGHGADPHAKDNEGRDAMEHMRLYRKHLRSRILHEQRKAGFSRDLPDLLAEQGRVRAYHDEIQVLLRADAPGEEKD